MNNKVIRIAQIMGKMNSGGVESVVMNYYKNIDKNKLQFDFIVDEDSTYMENTHNGLRFERKLVKFNNNGYKVNF